MDVRDRDVYVAHRVGTGAQEPPRRSGQALECRIPLPISGMARGGARVMRRMAERSLMLAVKRRLRACRARSPWFYSAALSSERSERFTANKRERFTANNRE